MKLKRISSLLILGISIMSLSSCNFLNINGNTSVNGDVQTSNDGNTATSDNTPTSTTIEENTTPNSTTVEENTTPTTNTSGNIPTTTNTTETTTTTTEVKTYYTVSYVSNGGNIVSSVQVLKGATATNVTNMTMAADSENTYTFAGWCSDSSLNNLFDFSTPIEKDTILYAKWNPIPITYDFKILSSIDNNELYSSKVNSGKTITEPTLDSINGYTFIDFYTDNTYSTKYNFSNKITNNTIIYAYYVSTASVNANLTILSYSGYTEGAYIEFGKIEGLDNISDYKVYYKGPSDTDYIALNENLIRITNSKVRADILGLSEDTYSIKVVAGTQTEIRTVEVTKDDRSGYAHFNNTGVGAYNDDGTLKANAVVVYVNDSNKNDVTATINGKTYTGLVNIIKKADKNYPLDIRVIGDIKTCQFNKKSFSSTPKTYTLIKEQAAALGGNFSSFSASDIISNGWNSYSDDIANGITELDGLSGGVSYSTSGVHCATSDTSSSEYYNKAFDTGWNMCSLSGKENITIEGVGTDAGIFQWGFTFSSCKNIEVKNLRFHNYTEDAVGIEGGSNFWLHNNTFDIGVNNWDFSDELDKSDGDGATDFKKASNLTISYCRYNHTHKTNLIGGSDSHKQYNVTLHHNFYNECSSRLPLGRQANMHMYNNYYYHCSTCQDIRANAFVLSEYNYFDKCSNPQKVTKTDTYTGTVIKSYNDYLTNCGSSAATVVTNRTDTLSGNCKPNGDTDYTNFDTNSSLFYYDSNKCSKVDILTKVSDIPTFVSTHAGAGALNSLVTETTTTTYTVIFNTNGGSTIQSQTIKSGKTISYVEPTKSGYIFSGWYTDSNLKNEFNTLTKITDNLTLYAKWTEEITISFNSNEGSTINDIKIAKGSSIDTLPTPTKDNYNFEGWYLDSGFNTKVTTSTTFNSSQTLYANWKEKGNNTVLTLNDFTEGTISSATTVGDLTIVVGKTTKINKYESTIEDTTITKYVSFSGGGSYSSAAIQFTTTSTANITVYFAGNVSSNVGRKVGLYNTDGLVDTSTVESIGSAASDSSKIVSYTFENIEAGSYSIASTNSSIEIYAIVIS